MPASSMTTTDIPPEVVREAYSTGIWVARIQGLQAHLRLIRKEVLGFDNPHLQRIERQAMAGIEEGRRYIEDCEWGASERPAPTSADLIKMLDDTRISGAVNEQGGGRQA